MTVVVTVTKAQVSADAKLQAPDNFICESGSKEEISLVIYLLNIPVIERRNSRNIFLITFPVGLATSRNRKRKMPKGVLESFASNFSLYLLRIE